MKCPSCRFENPSDEARCFRCSAWLGDLANENLLPPRKKGAAPASFLYDMRIAFRKFCHGSRLDPALQIPGWISPMVPPAASLLLPGLGQILNHRYGKAILFFFSWLCLLIWHYWDCFHGFCTSGIAFAAYVQTIGNFFGYILIIHTWIVFDAYVDSVRDREKRRIGVGESTFASLLITMLLICALRALVSMTDGVITPVGIPNVGNLSAFSIARNDALLLDRSYFRRNSPAAGQIVENLNPHDFRTGGEVVRGMNPGVILALPGEDLTISEEGIYREARRVAPLPRGWENARLPESIKVPPQRYFVLPAVAPDEFPGPEAFCLDERGLGGKFVLVFQPSQRRRVLP